MGKEQIHELNTDIRQYLLTKLVCVFVPQLITWAWPTQMISPTSWIYQMLNRWTLHYSEIVSEDKALDDLSLMHSFPLCVLSDQIIPQVISCNVLSVPQVRWFYEYCVCECISCLGVCVLVVSAQFHNFFSFIVFTQMTRLVLPGMVERYWDKQWIWEHVLMSEGTTLWILFLSFLPQTDGLDHQYLLWSGLPSTAPVGPLFCHQGTLSLFMHMWRCYNTYLPVGLFCDILFRIYFRFLFRASPGVWMLSTSQRESMFR